MKAKISWDEIEVQENIGQTLVKILMLKGEKGDTGTTDYNDLLNKPTKLSDFTNDGVFITNAVNDLANYYLKSETYTQSEINNLISVIPKFAIAVVNSLPTQDISTTTIYLVPSTSETTDMYKEYIYINNAWELLGIQKADLTNYYTKSETDTLLSTKANTSSLSAVATSGSYTDLSNTPNLATVATSGSYTDLSNTPTIPTMASITDAIYPVGAIYMSVNSTSPQTLFGGTWEQIQDKFLLASGTTYSAGSTGGSAAHTHTTGDHTLTTDEIPSHDHQINESTEKKFSYEDGGWATFRSGSENVYPNDVWTKRAGGGQAHNHGNTGSSSSLPPYLSVYVWKRTA